jgi:hypothetical protein
MCNFFKLFLIKRNGGSISLQGFGVFARNNRINVSRSQEREGERDYIFTQNLKRNRLGAVIAEGCNRFAPSD